MCLCSMHTWQPCHVFLTFGGQGNLRQCLIGEIRQPGFRHMLRRDVAAADPAQEETYELRTDGTVWMYYPCRVYDS